MWLPPSLAELIGGGDTGFVFGTPRGNPVTKQRVAADMKRICEAAKMPRTTPHDLRRTHGTTVTSLGFTPEQMNRLQNHKAGGIESVYDRHHYRPEFWEIQSAVVKRLTSLAKKPVAEKKKLQSVS